MVDSVLHSNQWRLMVVVDGINDINHQCMYVNVCRYVCVAVTKKKSRLS